MTRAFRSNSACGFQYLFLIFLNSSGFSEYMGGTRDFSCNQRKARRRLHRIRLSFAGERLGYSNPYTCGAMLTYSASTTLDMQAERGPAWQRRVLPQLGHGGQRQTVLRTDGSAIVAQLRTGRS